MRSRLQKNIKQGAKVTLEKFNKELESSQYAVSLKSNDFSIPPMFAKKDIKVQLKEINGKLEFDQNKYHNALYNDLMKKLLPLRVEFPEAKDSESRKEMAKEEFDAWQQYIKQRKSELPQPDFAIEPKDFSLIKENFDRFKVIVSK